MSTFCKSMPSLHNCKFMAKSSTVPVAKKLMALKWNIQSDGEVEFVPGIYGPKAA
jgi:hypothetical protein